jgi:diguanylate cyclase (GGDEF)-like protein
MLHWTFVGDTRDDDISPSYGELFVRALKDSYSYNPLKNGFIWFGFLWGIPVPVVTLWFHYHLKSHQLPVMITNEPIQLFFLCHPLLFAVLFGLMGSMVRHYIQRLKEESIRDGLTELYNHRYFRRELERRVNESERYDLTFCLVMLDLDHFKRVNDRHGHQAGDEVLRKLGDLLIKSTREADVVARYGGEEFAVILPETNRAEGTELAERIRLKIESHDFGLGESITISGGIAEYPSDGESDTALIQAADNRLYHAKESGRNEIKHRDNQD